MRSLFLLLFFLLSKISFATEEGHSSETETLSEEEDDDDDNIVLRMKACTDSLYEAFLKLKEEALKEKRRGCLPLAQEKKEKAARKLVAIDYSIKELEKALKENLSSVFESKMKLARINFRPHVEKEETEQREVAIHLMNEIKKEMKLLREQVSISIDLLRSSYPELEVALKELEEENLKVLIKKLIEVSVDLCSKVESLKEEVSLPQLKKRELHKKHLALEKLILESNFFLEIIGALYKKYSHSESPKKDFVDSFREEISKKRNQLGEKIEELKRALYTLRNNAIPKESEGCAPSIEEVEDETSEEDADWAVAELTAQEHFQAEERGLSFAALDKIRKREVFFEKICCELKEAKENGAARELKKLLKPLDEILFTRRGKRGAKPLHCGF